MADALKPERLAEIRARLRAATPGPWRVSAMNDAGIVAGARRIYVAEVATAGMGDAVSANATLIAHAPTDLADLLAEVERLRGIIDRLTKDRDADQLERRG